MSDKHLEEVVRAAVERALERQLSSLRKTSYGTFCARFTLSSAGKSGASAESLQKAIATIQVGSKRQKEILRALLENTVLGSGRAALFVVRGGSATGWQGVGFASNEK